MAKTKKLCILLGVLATVCIAAVLIGRMEQRQEDIRSGQTTVLALDTGDASVLSWEYAGSSFSFHREDGLWCYDDDEAFPVDQDAIEALLTVFADFTASFTIENADTLSQYGLEAPTASIHIETAEDAFDILVGDYSQMDSQRYVSIGDGCVYLATSDPLDSYNVLLAGLIRHDDIPSFSTDTVTSLRFDGDEGYTASYQADSTGSYDAEDVFFTTLNGASLALDTSLVRSYLSTMTYLDLTDYVTYTADDGSLDVYGLDDPELTVTVSYTVTDEDSTETEETFLLSVSRDPQQRDTEVDGDDPDSITAYARVGGSSIVYQISGSEYLELMAYSRNDLRHQELLWCAFTDITSLEVMLEDETYTLTVETDGDDHVWYYGDQELSISELQSALTGLTAESFTTTQPTGREELRMTVYLDNENVPSVELTLYRHDGDFCLAEVDGVPTAYVSRTAAMKLVEAINAIVL